MIDVMVVRRVRAEVSLLELAREEGLALRRRGGDWWACCPFHAERTGSFKISEQRNGYKCFGCGAAGDVISFHLAMRRLDARRGFPEAVRQLAARAAIACGDTGDALPSPRPGQARRKRRSREEVEAEQNRRRERALAQRASQGREEIVARWPWDGAAMRAEWRGGVGGGVATAVGAEGTAASGAGAPPGTAPAGEHRSYRAYTAYRAYEASPHHSPELPMLPGQPTASHLPEPPAPPDAGDRRSPPKLQQCSDQPTPPTTAPLSPHDQARALLRLFPAGDVVWCGEVRHSIAADDLPAAPPRWREEVGRHFRPVADWLASDERPGPRICAAPFRAASGCSRSLEAAAPPRFLVVEHDRLPLDAQGALLRWLREKVGLRLRAVVFTGNKSLHGWFDFPDTTRDLARLKAMLCGVLIEQDGRRRWEGGLGFDPAIWNPVQPWRLPGWRHDKTGRRAELWWLEGGAQ